MDVRILGPLEVWTTGRSLPLGGTKQRAVLAMLALHANQVVGVDQLVDGLWGQAPPHRAVNAVQVYISRLRRTLAGGRPPGSAAALTRRSPGYLLELDPDELDLGRFERLTRTGDQALPAAPEHAAATLRQALRLWRGPPLADLADEPFAPAQIARLEEQRLTALQARIEAELALGRHAELVGELQALVASQPLREGLHHQLLRSLYRSGRQAEALEAYRRARRTLIEELGIEPGRALQELQAAMLAQDPRLDWTPPPDRAPPADPTTARAEPAPARLPDVRNVPVRNPHFTGRDGMLRELHRRLHTGEQTLVVQALYGLGGVGKTQLAIEYAHRFAADYDLVWWVNAEQPALIADQLAHLADKLSLPARATMADTLELLLAILRRRPGWLLIFDNAERPEHLADYRPDGVGHVLITSRQPGWGALGGRLEVDVLTRPETVALLRRRIPEVDDRLADGLADELGDLPLAAAQAAAYLEQTGLPPAEYLHRFRTRRASLLARGEVLGYQGRLDTTWTLSLDRLRTGSPAAVPLLELAAWLAPEPIPLRLLSARPELLDEPLRAAAADPDLLDDVLGAVVGLSLARRQPDAFQLHRLVQAVIRQRPPAAQRQATVDRVLTLLAAAHPGSPNDPATWSAYAELAPHVLATGPLGDDRADSRRLVLSTVDYLNVRGDSRTSRMVAHALLDRWRHHLGADHPDTLRAATILTFALAWLGEHKQARTLGEDTLGQCRQVLDPDHPHTLRAATALTFTLAELGEHEQARELGQDTLERCQRLLDPDHLITLHAAGNLTLTLVELGEHEQARTLGQDALKRCQRVFGPDHLITLRLMAVLTYALAGLGEHEQACELGQDALDRCRRALGPDHHATLSSAAVLTYTLAWVGGHEQARTLGQDTLERSRRALGPDHLATLGAATGLTLALAGLGEHEQARTLGQDTLERSRRALGPDHLATLGAATGLTLALAGLGEHEQARTLGQDTLERSRRALGPDHLATLGAATGLTLALAGLGEHEQARTLGQDTLERSRRALGPDHPATLRLTRALSPLSSARPQQQR
jgi:DNA-binding SARP family transcriptional activator